MIRWLDRLDRSLGRVEQAVAVVALATMALVLAASVVHRVASRPEGRLSTGLLHLAHRLGWSPAPAFVHGPVSSLGNLALTVALLYLGLRSRPTPRNPWTCLGISLLLTGLGAGLVQALVTALPQGLPWAPALGLACMLWASLLGASLAVPGGRHLSLEVAAHLYPRPLQPALRRIGLALASATCAVLAVLALQSVHEHWQTATLNPGAARLLPTPVPLWCVLAVLPWSLGRMAWRFLRRVAARPA